MPTTTRKPRIAPAAAAHMELAIAAAEQGDRPRAIGHLLDIDEESWVAIRDRLADIAAPLAAHMAACGVPVPQLTPPT